MRMKNLIVLFAFALSFNSFSQSVVFKSMSGEILEEDTITIISSYEEFDISFFFRVHNTATEIKKISVTRFEEDVLPHTSSYFCWSVCLGVTTSGDVPVYNDPGFVSMHSDPTASIGGNLFEFHHDPNYQVGTSLFRLHFYDVDNPTDSSNIWCRLITLESGLDVSELNDNTFNIPNPIDTKIDLPQGVDATLIDATGKIICSEVKHSIETSTLQEGIYFITLRNGELIETKRIMIKH